MSKVLFGEKDRERWSLPEVVEWDPRDIAVADLEELSDRFEFDMRDWPNVLFGELTLEQAGDPDAVPVPPKWQTRAVVWMALRQNGQLVSWDEAGEARTSWLRFVASEGKAPARSQDTSEPSGSPEPSTTRRSASSSTSRKRK